VGVGNSPYQILSKKKYGQLNSFTYFIPTYVSRSIRMSLNSPPTWILPSLNSSSANHRRLTSSPFFDKRRCLLAAHCHAADVLRLSPTYFFFSSINNFVANHQCTRRQKRGAAGNHHDQPRHKQTAPSPGSPSAGPM
jgi:hypothetical protein